MPIINSVLINRALEMLGDHGVRTYAGMYVDKEIASRWSVEKTAEHYKRALERKEKMGDQVVMVVEHDLHFYREVQNAVGIHEAWKDGGVKDLYLVDNTIWPELSFPMKVIGEDGEW